MGHFIVTPFNKDCPHHKLYLTLKPERCPYCGALSHFAARQRVHRVLFWVGLATVVGYWVLR